MKSGPLRFCLALIAIATIALSGRLIRGASVLMQPVVGAVPLSFFLAAGLIASAIAFTGIHALRADRIEDSR